MGVGICQYVGGFFKLLSGSDVLASTGVAVVGIRFLHYIQVGVGLCGIALLGLRWKTSDSLDQKVIDRRFIGELTGFGFSLLKEQLHWILLAAYQDS